MKYIYVRIAQLIEETVPLEFVIQDIQSQLTVNYKHGDGIIFTAVVEKLSTLDKTYINSILDRVGNYAQTLNIPYYYLLHDTARESTKDRKNVYYLNTWAYITYKRSLTMHTNKWYPNVKKALFLIGKPLKRQRIGLMHHFYKNNLLDYLDYSLHFPVTGINVNQIKALNIDYLQDHRYISKLLTDIQKPSIDIDISKCYDTNVFEYTGFPTNLKYYKNTCLSIISENSFEINPNNFTNSIDMPYLTEKLYRAIINHHPFIIIGDTGINEHLLSLGYKTFDKFFLPYTDRISTEAELILEWTAKSIKHFMDNLDNNIDEIREIVTHNFYHFMQQTEQELKFLNRVPPGLELDHADLLGKL